jgi:hypothetical protein
MSFFQTEPPGSRPPNLLEACGGQSGGFGHNSAGCHAASYAVLSWSGQMEALLAHRWHRGPRAVRAARHGVCALAAHRWQRPLSHVSISARTGLQARSVEACSAAHRAAAHGVWTVLSGGCPRHGDCRSRWGRGCRGCLSGRADRQGYHAGSSSRSSCKHRAARQDAQRRVRARARPVRPRRCGLRRAPRVPTARRQQRDLPRRGVLGRRLGGWGDGGRLPPLAGRRARAAPRVRLVRVRRLRRHPRESGLLRLRPRRHSSSRPSAAQVSPP